MTPTVTSNYPTDRLYSLFYVSGSIDSFFGDEMRQNLDSTSEKSLQNVIFLLFTNNRFIKCQCGH